VAQLVSRRIKAAQAGLSGRIEWSLNQLRLARSICLPLTVDLQTGATLEFQIDARNQLLKNLGGVRSHLAQCADFRTPKKFCPISSSRRKGGKSVSARCNKRVRFGRSPHQM
jgi:hypothetical protein